MRNDTRKLYTAYEEEIAKLNGVERVDRKFSVLPSVQQRLETKVQESSEFLTKINVHGAIEQEGEKVGLGVSGPVAGTTDTSVKDRQTKDIATLDDLTGLSCFISLNGVTIYDQPAVHGNGDPMTPFLAWANRKSDDLGGLKAGQIITTGSLCGGVLSPGKGEVVTRLSPLATVTLTLR